MIDDML